MVYSRIRKITSLYVFGVSAAFAPYRVRPFEFAPTLYRVRPHTFRVRPHQVELQFVFGATDSERKRGTTNYRKMNRQKKKPVSVHLSWEKARKVALDRCSWRIVSRPYE